MVRVVSQIRLDANVTDPQVPHAQTQMSYRQLFREAQRKILLDALYANGWCIRRTAMALEVNRPHLYKMMHRLGIGRPNGMKRPHRGNALWRSLQ